MTRERAEKMFDAMGWRQMNVNLVPDGKNALDVTISYILYFCRGDDRMYLHNLEENTWWCSDRIEIFLDLFN